jgi:hypothetical protein
MQKTIPASDRIKPRSAAVGGERKKEEGFWCCVGGDAATAKEDGEDESPERFLEKVMGVVPSTV